MIRDLDHILAVMRRQADRDLDHLYPIIAVMIRRAGHDPDQLDHVLAAI